VNMVKNFGVSEKQVTSWQGRTCAMQLD